MSGSDSDFGKIVGEVPFETQNTQRGLGTSVYQGLSNAGRSVRKGVENVGNVGKNFYERGPHMAFGTEYTPQMQECGVNHWTYYFFNALLFLFCGSLIVTIINMSVDVSNDWMIAGTVFLVLFILSALFSIYLSGKKN